jgi:hypothetical protein
MIVSGFRIDNENEAVKSTNRRHILAIFINQTLLAYHMTLRLTGCISSPPTTFKELGLQLKVYLTRKDRVSPYRRLRGPAPARSFPE